MMFYLVYMVLYIYKVVILRPSYSSCSLCCIPPCVHGCDRLQGATDIGVIGVFVPVWLVFSLFQSTRLSNLCYLLLFCQS
jgi:hypothetical protein